MKPVKQTKRGGPDVPPEERGDCFDACLASVLEVDISEVPCPHDVEDWWAAAVESVARHGYRLLMVYDADQAPRPYTAAEIGEWLGDVYWLAAVPSLNLGTFEDGRPIPHVVVMRGSDLVHDPTLGEPYGYGPLKDTVPIFDAMILVPLAMEAEAA